MKELLPKINAAMEETFVGNYKFQDDELMRIFDLAGCLLRNYDACKGSRISQEFDSLIFIAVVHAVRSWKSNESTFWDYIFIKLVGINFSQKIYKHFTEVIDRLGTRGRILYLSGCAKRYYATILAHAFAPLSSTESFLELCWNLYSEDMNFTYSKSDEVFSLVVKELKRRFTGEKSLEDDLRLGKRVYSLRAGIKRMAIDSPEILVQLVETTISHIDRIFSGEILDDDCYYNSIVRDWWIEKEKAFGVIKSKRKNYEKPITDYTTIRPKYIYNGKQAVLTIPSIRLKNNFYDIPLLNIYRSGTLVNQIEMRTFGSGLIMSTKEFALCINDLIQGDGTIDCSLVITHCDEIIYDSKTSLYREYILFRDHREIMQDECLPGNYILLAPSLSAFSIYPRKIKRLPNEPNLYNLHSEEGEQLQNSKRTILFVLEKQKRDIKIVADRKSKAKFVCEGEEYIIIDGDLKVVVRSDIDIANYGIRYEMFNCKLKDFTFSENEGYKLFLITEFLNVNEPQKISIFNYSDNSIVASYNVIKFNSISITYDKLLYFDKSNLGTVRFLTKKYDKSVTFDINEGDIVIPFDDGDILLSPPTLKWKIGDGLFSTHYEEDLWYKNYSNSAELTIDLPAEMGYQVYLSNNSLLPESATFNSFKLGETIWSMRDENRSEITVFLKIENAGIIPILTICLKEKFTSSPFIISGDKLYWDAIKAFIGESTSKFKISFYKGECIVYSFEIREVFDESYKGRWITLNELEIGIYNVTVDLLSQGWLKKATRLFEHQVIFGDINSIRFKGKRLRFEKVMLTGEANYEEIQPFYADNLRYICEIDSCYYYIGSAYIINRDGLKIYLNRMLNSDGTYDNINPIRIELRSDKTCFIVAGVNPDNITDFLDEFTLDTRNKISNSNMNTRGIDYFLFSIEEENPDVQSSHSIIKHQG